MNISDLQNLSEALMQDAKRRRDTANTKEEWRAIQQIEHASTDLFNAAAWMATDVWNKKFHEKKAKREAVQHLSNQYYQERREEEE